MKIISKYKDYYDYLSGIYGVDEKIVLDRRKHDKPYFGCWEDPEVWSVVICGKRIDFVHQNGNFFYGQELVDRFPKATRLQYDSDLSEGVVSVGRYHTPCRVYESVDHLKINHTEKCPIILCQIVGSSRIGETWANNISRFPKLADIEFQKAMKPKDIYLLLCDWLSPKESPQKSLSDKEKIVAAGFDLKTSFRGK